MALMELLRRLRSRLSEARGPLTLPEEDKRCFLQAWPEVERMLAEGDVESVVFDPAFFWFYRDWFHAIPTISEAAIAVYWQRFWQLDDLNLEYHLVLFLRSRTTDDKRLQYVRDRLLAVRGKPDEEQQWARKAADALFRLPSDSDRKPSLRYALRLARILCQTRGDRFGLKSLFEALGLYAREIYRWRRRCPEAIILADELRAMCNRIISRERE